MLAIRNALCFLMARIVAFTAKALDGSGLPLIRDEETDGSNCQVTARVRMVPPRAFPRNLVTPYRCSLQMASWISHRSIIQRPSPCYLEAENIPRSVTFFNEAFVMYVCHTTNGNTFLYLEYLHLVN